LFFGRCHFAILNNSFMSNQGEGGNYSNS